MDPEFPKLAYESALHRLRNQEQLLGELRARAGLLLATAAIAASVLGRPALDANPRWLVILAVVAVAVSIAASLYVLLPKEDLVFTLIGREIFEQLYPFRDDMPEVHRRLAYDLERFWSENDATLQRVFLAVRVGAWALVTEVVVLLAALSDTLG